MGGFSKPVGGQTQGNSKVFVLLDGSLKPLLQMLEEIFTSEEWDCERDVGSWRCLVAIVKCLVDDVEGSTSARLFELGSHASNR